FRLQRFIVSEEYRCFSIPSGVYLQATVRLLFPVPILLTVRCGTRGVLRRSTVILIAGDKEQRKEHEG
ncbi:MAG: hypothetical protein J6031_06705, partial [Bacteroidales bacterium]|nr:hypothetical protein [Bacteroidales bacterium]